MKKRVRNILFKIFGRGFETDKIGNKLARNAKINNVQFEGENFVGFNSSVANSSIGKHSYIGKNAVIRDAKIGRFCSIGPDVKIGLGIHPTNLVSTHPAFYANNKPYKTFADKLYIQEYQDVELGHDVWIAGGVQVVGGVRIGTGAVVAAGSVVTKDLSPYGIYGGIPAKLIKYRFSEETCKSLLESKWWEISSQELREKTHLFRDVEAFLNEGNNRSLSEKQ